MSLSDLLKITYAGAQMECESFGVTTTPILEKARRNGTKVVITGLAHVEAASYSAAATALGNALAALNRSGGDLKVVGPAGPIFSLLSALCLGGGPHIEAKAKPASAGATRFDIEFTATADKAGEDDEDPSETKDSYRVTTKVRPDGLREITRKGKVSGQQTVKSLLVAIYPAWQLAYALPKWVTELEYDSSTDADQTDAEYTMTAVELSGSLPNAPFGPARDGSYTKSVDLDEQYRKVTTHSFDLLTSDSPLSLVDEVRPKLPAVVLRESVAIEQIREKRLRATFVVLESASGNDLMNFNQTVEIEHYSQAGSVGVVHVCDVVEYPGADPVVREKPKSIRRIHQSGSMICLTQWYLPPNPLTSGHTAPPKVAFTKVSPVEYQTSWDYQLYDTSAGIIPNPIETAFKFAGPIGRTIDLTPAKIPTRPAGTSALAGGA